MRVRKIILVSGLSILLLASLALAENIDPNEDGSQYAYGENVGWLNFEPNVPGDPCDWGVTVSDTELTGFIWAENIGWLNLWPAVYGGVFNDGTGQLSGYAWGQNVGWINFEPNVPNDSNYYGVTIDSNGTFSGWAYGQNIGWIHLRSEEPIVYKVQTSWVVPIWDSDGDGIEEPIDTAPTVDSNDFIDAASTNGTITDRGDQILTITDEPDPDGVRIKASPAGGTIPASVSVCDDETILTLNAGDEAVVTCGSVEIKVVSGIVEVTFVPIDGPAMTTSLAAGNSLTFEAATLTITAPSTNPDVVVVVIEGEKFYLAPGESLIFNQPPVAVCQDVTVSAGPDCTADASVDDGSYDPDGDPITVTQDPPGPYGLGDTDVTLTVTDDKGASDMCSATVTVVDTTPPVITCPADVIVECAQPTDPGTTGEATATDNCDPEPIITYAGLVYGACPEVIERTWTATDAAGNISTCVQTITVQDTTPPVITGLPADETVECDSVPPPAEPTATDNCDPDVPIVFTETRTDGDCPSRYTLTRTWTATDDCGNSTTETQVITVQDTTPPVFTTTPQDMTVECDGSGNSAALNAWLTSAAAGDTCGSVSVTNDFTALSDGCGATGTATVTWTATDACGNSASCSATVRVVDTTPPDITCPADMILECPADTAPSVTGEATATDTCGDVTITYSDVSVPGPGNTETITRTWTATDECGNSSSCVQTIAVVDTTPPTINSVSADPNVLWPLNHKMVEVTVTVDAEDDCDPAHICQIVDVTSNEPINGPGDGNTEPDWAITGDLTVNLRVERAGGGNGRVYTIHVKCTDASENTTTATVEVTVPHDQGKGKGKK